MRFHFQELEMTDSELKVNRSPFGRLIKQLLIEAKKTPDPSYPYSLQLTLWGLENLELVGPWKSYRLEMQEQAELMLGLNPDLVNRVLIKDMRVEELNNPQQATTFLLENLYDVIGK